MGQATGEPSIGELLGQLAEDASGVVRAELELYREKAVAQIALARTGLLMIAFALFFAQAAITAALVGFGIILVRYFGPIPGGLISAAIGICIAAVLAFAGIRKFRDAFPVGNHEDKK